MVRLYGTVPAEWLDPWGDKHHVEMVVQAVDVVEVGTFAFNNGYGTSMNRVYLDDCGATYLEVPPIDFGGSTYYLRKPPENRVWWRSRLPRRCIGKDGQPYVEVGA